ncbi:helical membrane plugin domain-containing protein [Neobacillus sp. Marseille-QA0830]
MAKPIRQINKSVPNPVEEQAQALSDVLKAITDNREAIVTSLDILKQLQDMGALTAIQSLLVKRTEVGAIAIGQINQPTMQHAIKNAMNAFKFFGSLDPEQVQTMIQSVSGGLERFTETMQHGESKSLWKLSTSLFNPEVRASLTTMMEFLHGMGESIHHDQQPIH